MPTILAISGSLRAASFNTHLLRAAIAAAPPGTQIEHGSIAEFPLYNGDVEAAGAPAAVRALKDRVIASDALLLVSPEYNQSIPGVLKNAIDWLSRPPAELARVFGGRPVGVIGATPGGGGTVLAQAAWVLVLRALGALPYFGARVQIAHASQAFDASGALTSAAERAHLEAYLVGFAQFIDRHGLRGEPPASKP